MFIYQSLNSDGESTEKFIASELELDSSDEIKFIGEATKDEVDNAFFSVLISFGLADVTGYQLEYRVSPEYEEGS